MPVAGAPASIEVFSQFQPALVEIETNTHIVVLAWLHQSDRTALQARGRRPRPDLRLRGVFGLRSSSRPNPIGLTATRLLSVSGNSLSVERLDFVDGTPVIDIKRYSPGWDSIFSARTDRERRPPAEWGDDERDDMLTVAANFHGERCYGLALAVRAMTYAAERWQLGRMDPKLIVTVGDDGCIADGLQALTGATFGNGRLRCIVGPAFYFQYGSEQMTFIPTASPASIDEVWAAPLEILFRISLAVG